MEILQFKAALSLLPDVDDYRFTFKTREKFQYKTLLFVNHSEETQAGLSRHGIYAALENESVPVTKLCRHLSSG